MGDISRALLEAHLRARAAQSDSSARFDLAQVCFGPQLDFVNSPAKRKIARCTRRSGKTTGTGALLLHGAVTPPYANQGFITLSLKNAKRLVWPTLKRLNDEWRLGGIANETDGSLRFPHLPNQPNIYLGGVKDRSELDKIRGWEGGAKRFVVDEAQAIRTSLFEELIDEVIEPAILDYDGQIIVTGTPGPVCAGYFHDIDIGKKREGWDHFFWTLLDNPHLERKSGKPTQQILDELRQRRGWTVDHPTFVREYLGQWVSDPDALVFKYNAGRNGFTDLPAGDWSYVMGVDLGFEDADAIAILGWRRHDPTVYLVAEHVQKKAGITELATVAVELFQRYRPIKIAWDFGGLGKKIAEEVRRRHALPIEPADKVRKFEHIELLNDAILSGRFKAKPSSAFAEDAAIVQWDMDERADGKLKIAEDFHSDITDAVLYAFRACYHWLERPAPPKPKDEHEAHIKRLVEQQARERSSDGYAAMLGFDD